MERIWNWVYAEELGTLSEEVSSSFFPWRPLFNSKKISILSY
jgi:hypothetical protein